MKFPRQGKERKEEKERRKDRKVQDENKG